MNRAYYSKNLIEFLVDDNSHILGELTKNHQFALEEQQRNAGSFTTKRHANPTELFLGKTGAP